MLSQWAPSRLGYPGACLAFVGLSLVLSGCTQNTKIPTYPVEGEVFVAGKPAAGATIVFYPKGENTPPVCPNTVVEPNGSFRLTSFTALDGAPEGEYVVTVTWAPTVQRDGETYLTGPDKLRGRYANRTTTTLRATVQNGTNKIPRFDLK
jgi:hypothetical protein